MKILNSKIDWMEDWDNYPTINLDVEKMPEHDEYLYRAYPVGGQSSTLYVSDNTEFVKFFLSSGDKSGYGGRTFTLKMENGETVDIVGPWSSNPTSVYQITNGEVDCVTAYVLETKGDFPKLRYHGQYIRPELAEEICHGEGAYLIHIPSFRNQPSMSPVTMVKPRTRNGVTEMKEY